MLLVPVFVPIRVDIRAPQIKIDTPARGTFLRSDQQHELLFQGSVTDSVTGVASLTVNGEPLQLGPNGEFELQYQPAVGGDLVVVQATDNAGHVGTATRGLVYGTFAPWESPVVNGIERSLRP